MGEFEGYEAFFVQHYVDLVRTLWSYCGDRELAEEAAQEAFVRASRQWRRVAAMRSPAGWLYRVALNVVHGHHRRDRAGWRAVVRHGAVTTEPPVDVAGSLTLHEALRQLPARQRAALALHYFAGLQVAEVADALDAREGTVKSLLSRGRAALRHQLADVEEASDARKP